MKYNRFQDLELSALGFGCMRFPVFEDKSIDKEQVEKMFDYAIANGINYFDTAWPYHEGKSEIVTGKFLKKYPRDSFYLATKFPGFPFKLGAPDNPRPEEIFEKQLEKCGVEYFDFYLCHNVSERTIPIFEDPEIGIIPYLLKQKELGRIKHLGFSCHAQFENLKAFVERHPDTFEFCQIQLNYLDWTLQQAKEKYEFLTEKGIPVWVMEGIRGGKLASLPKTLSGKLKALRPEASEAEWAIRWVQSLPNVCVQLSGMSNMTQVEENIRTMKEGEPLSKEEFDLLLEIAEGLKRSVPCTKCRYCCDGCPMELDIPDLVAQYNAYVTQDDFTVRTYINSLPEDKQPSACVACGQCTDMCPQNINVPAVMERLAAGISGERTWEEICQEHDADLK